MTSKERENFLRNAILVVDHSKAALVSLVELDLQNKGQTFEQFINTNQHEIYHLYNSSSCCQCPPGHYPPRSRRILHQSQMELLFDRSSLKLPCHNTVRRSDDFCCSMARSGLCTDVLDLTLARCLLVNLYSDVFWFSCLQFQSITLEDFLNHNKHTLYHLWQNNTPCCQCPPGYTFPTKHSMLYQNDWTQMFNSALLPCTNHRKRHSPGSMQSICSVAAAPGITLLNLDPSVGRIILQHCCTLRTAVETLVQIRNQDYGHAKDGIMSDNDYNTSISNIERCIIEIAKLCNKETQFKQKLQEAKDGALDQTLFTQYQNNLMETLTRQADIHQSVADLAPTINKIGKQIAEKSGKIPKLMNECVQKGYDYQEQLMEKFNQTLVRVKNQTNMEIDCHVKEGTFVETNVIRRFKKWMPTKDVFVIIGSEGTGKSRNGLEMLRLFGLTDKDFDLLKVTDFQQVKDILTDERKTVVLLDDILPFKECSCKCLINYHILDLLNARKCKGGVKIIFTLNFSKMNSLNDLLASHRLFKNCCKIDLSSDRFSMSEDEKVTLMFNFCKQCEIDITWDSLCSSNEFYLDGRTVYEIAKTEPYIGYPKSCFMFTSNKRILQLGINFFKHPDQSLMDEINSLRDSTDTNLELNVSYALLVYALLNTGCLDINKLDISKLETIVNSFRNSQRRPLFKSKVKKVAEQMDGRFLKQDSHTMVYYFKHPMIYEALAISYFEVNPSEVILVLNFDFIIDLTKLEFDDFEKQEISLIIAKELFGHLTKQIFTLFEKDYKMRSAEFIKTLCGSAIILQNNPDFLGLLIREFNNCTSQDTIDIQIEGRREHLSFNFPSAILWYLIQKYNVDKHIATVLHFIENDMKDNQNLEKVIASKKVILACFYYICEIENSDMKLELIYGSITDCGIECNYDFSIQIALENGNDTAVSFILSHVSTEIDIVKLVFEVEHEEDFKRLCDLISTNLNIECFDTDNKTYILKFLCRSVPMNFFNRRKSIITACIRLRKDLVTELLIDVRPLTIDTGNVVNTACENGWEDVLKILLKKKLCNQNEKKQIFIASCKNGMDTFLEWMLLTVDKYVLDVQEFLLLEFRCENFETVKNFILKLQNNKEMETMIKKSVTQFNLPVIRLINWVIEDTDNQIDTCNKNDLHNLYIVQWIYDKFPNLQSDVRNTVYKTINDTSSHPDEILQWLRENTKTVFPPITSFLAFSCKHDHQIIVKWILQTFDHNTFNMHELVIDAYELGYHKTVEVISKVDLNKVDITSSISAMLSQCQNNWSKDLFLFLIQKLSHTYCKWMEIITKLIDLDFYDYIELIVQHVDNSKIDMMKIVKNKMNVLSENKLKDLIQSIKKELLDINYIVLAAFKIGYNEIVAWSIINDDQNAINKSEVFHAAIFNGNTNVTQYLLENIDHKLLDMKTAVDIGCRRGKFDIIEMLLLNVDDEALCYFMRKVFVHGSLNVIRFLIDNIDISLIDLGAAMNEACRNGKSEIVERLIESYNDTIDLNRLIQLACERNWLDIVNSITQTVGISIFDLKTAMIEACRFRRMDIVRLLIQNNKYKFFDFTTVISDACRDRHIGIVETLVQHVDHNLLGMNDVIDHACRSDNLDQVKWLLENIDNTLFDMKTTMNNVCYEGMPGIVKWLIENVDNNFFDMKEAMNRACVSGKLDIAKCLIENVDNKLVDTKEAMNRACVWGRLDIIKWLIENVDNELFDMNRAMNNVCYTGELDIVKWLIENVDNKLFDMKVAMNDASFWGKLDIVKWLKDNVDNELFDMKT